jgi:hypothetical protein
MLSNAYCELAWEVVKCDGISQSGLVSHVYETSANDWAGKSKVLRGWTQGVPTEIKPLTQQWEASVTAGQRAP